MVLRGRGLPRQRRSTNPARAHPLPKPPRRLAGAQRHPARAEADERRGRGDPRQGGGFNCEEQEDGRGSADDRIGTGQECCQEHSVAAEKQSINAAPRPAGAGG